MKDQVLQKLASVTQTAPAEWKDGQGFDTGLGEDFFFVHPKLGEAHINVLQGVTCICLNGEEIYSDADDLIVA